jgi:hypothetical protein
LITVEAKQRSQKFVLTDFSARIDLHSKQFFV